MSMYANKGDTQMNTYRFVAKTRCGKTNVIVQNADTLAEAREKYLKHNAMTHTPMTIVKVETKRCGTWTIA